MTVPQHAAEQASGRGEMKWVHWRKAARGLLCAEQARLRLRHVTLLGADWAGDQWGLRGSRLPKPCPHGPGGCEGSSRVQGHHWEGWFPVPGLSSCARANQRNVFQVCSAALCWRQSSSTLPASAIPVSAFCRAHRGNVRSVVLCWSCSGQSLLNLSLKWHFHVGDRIGVILRQAVRQQSSAMSKNQTAEQ